ncbi:efflux RND transporter periplasmic adaptor subunit [Ferrimonas lipolytica]|uniref:Efflux RND transporter periplasmic adaptor subunit n=1 Tax=Ferrimonas lipolytica TaxID=2724191 RepID=A0A6H1UI00_9GAMM|nr:efflux RND transporter periplasmic adaptor subunit [Ferrimonas lipolytica]QIZ78711.1 efflux RND transporter periplasmic adaptor subunit [Ferrimonas lipolytica]
MSRNPIVVAMLISVALVLWLASGVVWPSEDESADKATIAAVKEPVEVMAKLMQAQPIQREVNLYGRTAPDRMATLRAEVRGRITAILAERGSAVVAGQPLVKLHQRDLPQQLARAQTTLQQQTLDFNGAQKLAKQGLQGELQLAQAKAGLASAEAEVARLQLEIDHTIIRAPFTGVLNERYVEIGDYLGVSDPVAMVADLDPLVVNAEVTEVDVVALSTGQQATANFIGDASSSGTLRYISSMSSEGTNTFRIEVALPNPNGKLRAGKSAELVLPLEQRNAIYITPALLALDEQGHLGVKAVEQGHVKFYPIEMVKADGDGVWTGGVPDEITVITVGQAFVRDGDPVQVSLESQP